MDNEMYKEFLELQLEWTINQSAILEEMENKLQEMKKIAVYAASDELSEYERETLNKRLKILKHEYDTLEKQRHTEYH